MKNRSTTSINSSSSSGINIMSSSSSSMHGSSSTSPTRGSSSSIHNNNNTSTSTTSIGVTTTTTTIPEYDYNIDSNDNVESQRLLLNVDDDTSSDMIGMNNTNSNNKTRNDTKFLLLLPISILLLCSILLFIIGWYGPRQFLMDQYIDFIIERNTPPYQIITNGGNKPIVILDPTYNHPVIEPPQISSSFLIFTSVTLPLFILSIWPFMMYLLPNFLIVSSCCWNNTASGWMSSKPTSTTIAKQKEYMKMQSSSVSSSFSYSRRYSPVIHRDGAGIMLLLLFYECMISISGLLCSIGICEGLTQCIKMYIGRLRPNMYQLCQFNVETLQYSTTIAKDRIREGHLSFPSGHSSLGSVSMIYCTWYILYTCQHHQQQQQQRRSVVGIHNNNVSLNNNDNVWTVLISVLRAWCILLLLPGWAIFVGLTRIVDHWHHVSDVLAGLLLGSLIGSIVFHSLVRPLLQFVKLNESSRSYYDTSIHGESTASTTSTETSSSIQLSASIPTTTTNQVAV